MGIPTVDLWNALTLVFDDAHHLGLCKVGSDRKILACTSTFARILGRDQFSVLGEDVVSFGDPSERDQAIQRFEEGARTQDRLNCIKHYIRPSGQRIACQLETKLFHDPNTGEKFFLTAIWEISLSSQVSELGHIQEEIESLATQLNAFGNKQPTIQVDASTKTNSPEANNGSMIRMGINDPAMLMLVGMFFLLILVLISVVVLFLGYQITHQTASSGITMATAATGLWALCSRVASALRPV